MSLSSYSALQESLLLWLARPGDTTIPIADCITLFESDASRKLRVHQQELSDDTVTVAGTASYALPDDFLEARKVSYIAANPLVLDYMTPAVLDDTWGIVQGVPQNYTIENENFRLGPVPADVYTIRIEYFSTIPALSDSNTSNWLLSTAPDAYLFGSLAEAELYLGADNADTRYAAFTQRREMAYQQIRLADRKYRAGSSPLLMKADPRMVF